MARQSITRNELYRMVEDFATLRGTHPGLAILMEPKMNRFHEANKMPIAVMNARFLDIKNKYVKKDDKGNFLTIKKGNESVWQFVENYVDVAGARELWDEEVSQRFEQECKDLFSQTIQIDV
jgi:hypothetical protein